LCLAIPYLAIGVSKFEHSLGDYLTKIAPGEVQTFLCAQVLDTLSQLDVADIDNRRLVVQMWETLPQPGQLTTDILQTLAEAAYGIWPEWYNQDELFLDKDGAAAETTLLNQFKCLDLKRDSQDICLPWLKQAVRACQTHKAPILPEFSRALQLSQLLLAIEPNHVIIVIVVADPTPANHQLLGLARTVQWLADKTLTPIALMLSDQLAGMPELDSVIYGAVSLPATTVDAPSPTGKVDDGAQEEAKHILVPVRGRPHPFSPGEKLLAERLTKDADLGPLFQFNRTVRTVYNSAYLVDLLWADGRVVVEVDGYRYHSNRFAFSRDRQRDYELLISGYVVLRLPHDEVVNDVEITVEKIRDVVRFRRHPSRPTSEVLQ
jgi:very-short-patch-repair endonuclease